MPTLARKGPFNKVLAAVVAVSAAVAVAGCTSGDPGPADAPATASPSSDRGAGDPLAADGLPVACDLGPTPEEEDPDVADGPVEFSLTDAGTAVMTGTIGADFVHRVCDLARQEPGVTEIELLDVPGSSTPGNETLEGGQVIRALGYATLVPGDGQVESGGVDFFAAGAERFIEDGGCLGVHSTGFEDEAGGTIAAADLPRDDPEHQPYLDYFADMGIDPDFYWFTLEAAPPDGIHYLTPAEIEEWGLVTGPVPTVPCPLPDDG